MRACGRTGTRSLLTPPSLILARAKESEKERDLVRLRTAYHTDGIRTHVTRVCARQPQFRTLSTYLPCSLSAPRLAWVYECVAAIIMIMAETTGPSKAWIQNAKEVITILPCGWPLGTLRPRPDARHDVDFPPAAACWQRAFDRCVSRAKGIYFSTILWADLLHHASSIRSVHACRHTGWRCVCADLSACGRARRWVQSVTNRRVPAAFCCTTRANAASSGEALMTAAVQGRAGARARATCMQQKRKPALCRSERARTHTIRAKPFSSCIVPVAHTHTHTHTHILYCTHLQKETDFL